MDVSFHQAETNKQVVIVEYNTTKHLIKLWRRCFHVYQVTNAVRVKLGPFVYLSNNPLGTNSSCQRSVKIYFYISSQCCVKLPLIKLELCRLCNCNLQQKNNKTVHI